MVTNSDCNFVSSIMDNYAHLNYSNFYRDINVQINSHYLAEYQHKLSIRHSSRYVDKA